MERGDGKPLASRLWKEAGVRWSRGRCWQCGWQPWVDPHPRQHPLVLQLRFHQLQGPVLGSEVCGARGDLANAFPVGVSMGDVEKAISSSSHVLGIWLKTAGSGTQIPLGFFFLRLKSSQEKGREKRSVVALCFCGTYGPDGVPGDEPHASQARAEAMAVCPTPTGDGGRALFRSGLRLGLNRTHVLHHLL